MNKRNRGFSVLLSLLLIIVIFLIVLFLSIISEKKQKTEKISTFSASGKVITIKKSDETVQIIVEVCKENQKEKKVFLACPNRRLKNEIKKNDFISFVYSDRIWFHTIDKQKMEDGDGEVVEYWEYNSWNELISLEILEGAQ